MQGKAERQRAERLVHIRARHLRTTQPPAEKQNLKRMAKGRAIRAADKRIGMARSIKQLWAAN
jgi:hypothetical protein